jgi:hypothetical protein
LAVTFNAFHAISVQHPSGHIFRSKEGLRGFGRLWDRSSIVRGSVYLSQAVSRNHDSQASISTACVDFDLIVREILEYTHAGDSGNYRTSKFGKPVMLDNRKVGLLPVFVLLLASYLLISPRVAHAQFPEGESKWAVMDVTAAINRSIEESKDGIELREKVVRRFSECSLMYGGLSTMASNAEAKRNYVQAQLATMEIESTIARPLQNEKRIELEEEARKSVAVMLRALNAQPNKDKDKDKEVGSLLRNCKAINDIKETKNAVRELSLQ